MKIKIFAFSLCALLSLNAMAQQQLKTIRTYHDPLFQTKLHEIYTVIKNTGNKQGEYKSYDENGFLTESAIFKNNLLNGAYVEYGARFAEFHPNHTKKVRTAANYVNGELQGNWTEYHIANGKYQIHIQRTYNKGEIVSETAYHDNGVKKAIWNANGLCTLWDEKGNKQKEVTRKNEKLNGQMTEWYPNGKIAQVTNYINGNLNGKSMAYYENGNILGEETDSMGVHNGKLIQYYENGDVFLDETYSMGMLNGNKIEYYQNKGIRIKQEYDAPGQLLSEVQYTEKGNKIQEIIRTKPDVYLTTNYDTISSQKTKETEQLRQQRYKKDLRIATFYANGKKKEVFLSNDNNKIRNEFYKEDGSSQVNDYDGAVYFYDKEGYLSQKTFPETTCGDYKWACWMYEIYDIDKKVTKTGHFDKNNKDLDYIIFENGIKQEEKTSGGGFMQYYPNGKIKLQHSADGSAMYYHEDGYLFQKTFPEKKCSHTNPKSLTSITYEPCRQYTIYDKSGEIKKQGHLSKKNEDLDYIAFENSVKQEEKIRDGGLLRYYPNGRTVSLSRPLGSSIGFGYYEDGKLEFKCDYETLALVEYYPNGRVKEKGNTKPNSTEKTGIWYLYNEKGELSSIRDNEVSRKPTPEEMKSHETIFIDLINAKEQKRDDTKYY